MGRWRLDGVLVGLLCLGIALSAPVIGGALQNGVYEVRSTVKISDHVSRYVRTESEGFSRNLRQDADFPPPVAPEDIETPGATAGDGGVEAVAEDENSGHKDLGDKLDEALDPLEQAAQDDETSNRDHGLVDHPTFDENAEEKEVVAVVPPGEGDSDGGESGAPQRLVDKHNNLFVLARPSGLLRQLVFYEDKTLLMDIVVLLVATSLGALVAAALKQPVIIAYLLAGMVVGPGGLDLIEELVQIETFSKLGLVLLLFLLGVEFSISSLRGSRGASPVLASVLGVGASAAVGAAVGSWLGEGEGAVLGLFIGCFISMSSTAVVLKCLVDFGQEALPFGQVCLVILIVQDFVLGFMLAMLNTASGGGPTAKDVGATLGVLVAFLVGSYLVARLVLTRLMALLSRLGARGVGSEVFQLGALCLCLTVATIAERVGLGMEVGAFIAGLMVSASDHVHETITSIEALRNFFAALFLSSLGMLMQPTFLWTYLNILAVGLAVVLVGKVLITTAILRLLRYPTNVALSVGVATAQVGEFGFVLLSKARAVGLVPVKVYLLLLGTTALSLLCTPLQWRLVNALNRGAPKGPRVSQQHELRGEEGGGGVGEGGEAAGHGERGKGSRSATDECATTPTRSGSPSWAGEDEGAPLVARGQTSSWIGGMDVDGEDDVEAARGGRGRRRTRAADVRDR